jgi:hypothetical protein
MATHLEKLYEPNDTIMADIKQHNSDLDERILIAWGQLPNGRFFFVTN